MSVAVALREDVAVLYVDAKGPYPGLVRDWYDEARDARTYAGTTPVVAHPPCGPWSSLKRLNKKQNKDCAPHAVEVVRRNGGVLEHPAGSGLWAHCGLPKPGVLPDAWGGVTYEVCQVDWGHVARKRPWLYVVGLVGRMPQNPPSKEPTHWVSGGREKRHNRTGGLIPPGIKACSAQQRRRTPIAFAQFLLDVASRCAPPTVGDTMMGKRTRPWCVVISDKIYIRVGSEARAEREAAKARNLYRVAAAKGEVRVAFIPADRTTHPQAGEKK